MPDRKCPGYLVIQSVEYEGENSTELPTLADVKKHLIANISRRQPLESFQVYRISSELDVKHLIRQEKPNG